jgi:DNA-binding TFAR19-related protein (PDSD5 family)
VELTLLIVVALVAAGTLALLLRGRPSTQSSSSASTVAPEEAEALEFAIEPSAELVLAPDEVLVVPPADPHASAVVLARAESMAVLEIAGLLTPRVRRKPFQQLVDRFTQSRRDGDRRHLRKLADEPLEGGYLKLSEESRRQLADGTPVVAKTGGMLGMVNNEKGHRKHLLRFTDYKTLADPNLIRAASTLKAMAALQEQLEAVEERLIEVQKTLGRLCQELDYDRLSEILTAKDVLEETARDVRRRGLMTQTDMIAVNDARKTIKQQLRSAHFNLADLTRGFDGARSRHQRLEVLEEVLQNNRLDFWLAVFVEAELAYVRSDALKLLYEASEHPESSAELEHDMREQIETRCAELAAVGTLLRDISDPEARRLLDHFQQISRYKLSRQRPLVEGLLARHGEVFSDQPVRTATA